jgi:hypothetical protein
VKNKINLSTSDFHLFQLECLAEQEKKQYEPWTGKDEFFFATESELINNQNFNFRHEKSNSMGA